MPYLFEIPIAIFLTVALILLLISAINPRYMWRKFESWKATSEPSDAFFISRRITSIIGIIILLVILLGPRIMYLFDK